MEEYVMRNHLLHSRKYLAASLCFLFFAFSLLTFPVQTIAQTRSSQRERRVQIFFAYNPTRPAAGQEVRFQDFSRGNPTSWLWDFGDGQTSVLQNPRHAFTTPGSYKVIMTARNNISSGRVSRTLNVILSISASFTYGPSYPVTGQAVQFTDTSTGGPTSWLWNFGDNTTSTSQNPSHTYTTAASYTVTLTVAFSSGSKTVSQTITVTPALVASFTYTPTSPVAGQAVQFMDTSTGSPTSWQWSSSDGATSTSQNPSHIFTTAGSYTVTLTVVYSTGSRSASQTITVLPPPALSASFTYSPSSPVAGQAIQFTDTSTGNPTSWLWNFGDNTTSTSKNPSHTFATATSYTVTLTVTNSSASKSVSQTINVLPASTFTASFTYSPSSPAAGQVVYFTDTSTGNPTSWQWNFGDGATSTSQNPSHAYATAASYTVTLTVTNSSGSKSASQTITVLSAFAASFTYSPSSPAIGQAVQFTDTSTGSPTSWQWNFGDSATSTIQNPSHTYAAAGSYWVNLIITKGTDSQSTSQMITVRGPATITAASPSYADVSAAVNSAVSGDTVIVPAGTASWNSNLVINKFIRLIGAGIGQTVITSNYTGTGGSNYWYSHYFLITFNPTTPSDNESLRLSGFTFDLQNKCGGLYIKNATTTAITKVRVDHTSWTGNTGLTTVFHLYGTIYGVADNNTWDNGRFLINGLDKTTWTNFSFNFGSGNLFYFEDNTITFPDGDTPYMEMGGSLGFRYNTCTTTQNIYGLMHMHDNGSGGHSGAMGAEVYENTFSHGAYVLKTMGLAAGKTLFYNNYHIGAGGIWFVIDEVHDDSINPPTNGPTGQPQHISDTYLFNNYENGSLILNESDFPIVNYSLTCSVCKVTVPVVNVHFWKHVSPFDGTNGVGVGTLAARPATCTKGVGYWATDEKKLYRCTAPNVWTIYYTPYTYPHPLRQILSN
jgi:PKD repeat protein